MNDKTGADIVRAAIRAAPSAAAGASPRPVQGLQSVADELTIQQLNDKVARLVSVQPSQARELSDEEIRDIWMATEPTDTESHSLVYARAIIAAIERYRIK